MKKQIIVFIMIFFAFAAFAQTVHGDFNGMWVATVTQDEQIVIFKFVVTPEKLFLEIITMDTDDKITSEYQVVDIITWLDTSNGNLSGRIEFPDGVILRVKTGDNYISGFTAFISREKNRMYIKELVLDSDYMLVFTKY